MIELLEARGASDEVLKVAREFHCSACERYRKPNTSAPAALPQASHFNEKLQADVMWIKLGKDKIPIVHIIDLATKYQAAAVVKSEKASNFIKALERGWFRHFGIPKELITDEGRGWLHEDMANLLAEHNILHTVVPGEAHTRMGAVERRHQVLRKAVEIFLNDKGLANVDGLRQALAYVLPQVNSSPTVAGYSPTQWVLGYQPDFAGDLTSEGLNPSHLEGADFEKTLEMRSAAKMALIKADQDQRLRRALLRRYSGTNVVLQPGQVCWYWRDARAADLVKVRWKGPARVILREDDAEGKPLVYWIAHQTQLLRCAPHHVRADYRVASDTNIGGLEEARRVVSELKSRGVTRFVDLQRANKRHIEEVQSDEEELMDDDDAPGPPRQRPRLTLTSPLDFGERPELDVSPTPTTPLDDSGPAMDLEGLDLPPAEATPGVGDPGGPPIVVDEIFDDPMPPPAALPLRPQPGPGLADETEPSEEPSRPPSERTPAHVPTLDPGMVSLYEPAGPNDQFRLQRLQHERSETMFLPNRSRTHRSRSRHRAEPDAAAPTSSTAGPQPSQPAETAESFSQVFHVDDITGDDLPHGWHVDSDGAFVLKDVLHDFWEVRAGCLIRHHVSPRRNTMNIDDYKDVPIEPKYLDPVRITMMRFPDGNIKIHNDDGSQTFATSTSWTGATVYQITGPVRRELAMFANLTAKKVGRDLKAKAQKTNSKTVDERRLDVDQRALFQAAKVKELQSFFQNDVWVFDTDENSDPSRTLSARMLLTWSKNPDGSPRAKARLIVRGYADVDALNGQLETSSPTTTRLSRNMLLSLAATLGWKLWTSDISTAFLQGLPQERKIWIKLPADALSLLGCGPNTRMLLRKPVYGQLDAPRRWYLEACRRLKSLNLRQHALDPCMFLIYAQDFEERYGPDDAAEKPLLDSGLVGMICLHVDDMLGCGDPTSKIYNKVIEELRNTFSFREWKDGDSLEYCGATMVKNPDGTIKLHHEQYLKKIKPMTLPRLGPEHEMSQQETTQLRGLLGSLQWPAVQSSPHLQASTSVYSGSVSKGLLKTAMDTNRLLKFAKENSDVGLTFAPLGPAENLRMITAFDASFCSRPDGTSQGGYFVLLAPKHVLETHEDVYHIVDWKSFKLPRVARSSLSAEAQSAGCAADATEFACRYYEHLLQPDVPLATLINMKSRLAPTLVTDAKALFDSYHRESLVSNVTDRRSSLEIRVVKEQISGLGGGLRWVSSDRQLADGMTKDSMRQQLADKLRHGRIKFLYDPNYVAAKKKSLEERKRELEATSKSRNTKKKKPQSELRIIHEELDASEDVEMPDTFSTTENDLAPQNEEIQKNDLVSDETYFAQSTETIVYVDMVQNALAPERQRALPGRYLEIFRWIFKLVMGMWLLLNIPGADAAAPLEMCLTEPEKMKTQGDLDWESIFSVLAILALLFAGIHCWRLRAAQQRLMVQIDDLNWSADAEQPSCQCFDNHVR